MEEKLKRAMDRIFGLAESPGPSPEVQDANTSSMVRKINQWKEAPEIPNDRLQQGWWAIDKRLPKPRTSQWWRYPAAALAMGILSVALWVQFVSPVATIMTVADYQINLATESFTSPPDRKVAASLGNEISLQLRNVTDLKAQEMNGSLQLQFKEGTLWIDFSGRSGGLRVVAGQAEYLAVGTQFVVVAGKMHKLFVKEGIVRVKYQERSTQVTAGKLWEDGTISERTHRLETWETIGLLPRTAKAKRHTPRRLVTLQLNNGQDITGEILHSDKKKIIVRNKHSGTFEILRKDMFRLIEH